MLSLASAATISDMRGAAAPSAPLPLPLLQHPPRLIGPIGEALTPSAAPHPAYSFIHGQQGFWRLAKTNQGVWWFVSPDDRPEFLNLVDTVQPVLHGRDPAARFRFH